MEIKNIYDDLKDKLKHPTIGKHLLDAGWITYAKTEGLYLSSQFGFGKSPDAWTLFQSGDSKADGSKLREPMFIDNKKEFRFYHDYYVHHYFKDAGIEKTAKLKDIVPGEDMSVYFFSGSREDIMKSEKAYAKRCHDLRDLLSWIPKSDALVILTADHGESFFEYYGDFSHTESHMVEEIAHIPLLIHWPGMEAQRIGMFTRDLDVAPTILELAGVKNVKLDGKSLVSAITEGKRWSSVYEDCYVHRTGEIWRFRFTPTEKKIEFVKELKNEKEKTK